ncbi:PhnD/SsuA/transferrin family substrate-binding protein [Megalodesulfovibrio paquesii]
MSRALACCCMVCLVVIWWPGAAGGQAASAEGTARIWRFGITDLVGLEQAREEWGAFARTLAERAGIALEFVPMTRRDDALRGFADKTLDLALTGPAEYVVLRKRTNATVLLGFSRPDYFSVLVTMADGAIRTVADLKGRKVAFGPVGSTSGHLAPMGLLKDLGLDPLRDISAVHGAPKAGWEAFLRGDAAAFAASDTAFRQLREAEPLLGPGNFRVLARSGDLPGDLLMVGAHLPAQDVQLLRDALLAHEAALSEAILSHPGNAKYKGMRLLRSMQDSDYNAIRAMYGAVGFPAYADFLK